MSGFFEQIAETSAKTGITNAQVESVMEKFLNLAKKQGLENDEDYSKVKIFYESYLRDISDDEKKQPFKELGKQSHVWGCNQLDDIDELVSTLIQKMEGKGWFARRIDDICNPVTTNANQYVTVASTTAIGAGIGACIGGPVGAGIGAGIGALVGIVARWF